MSRQQVGHSRQYPYILSYFVRYVSNVILYVSFFINIDTKKFGRLDLKNSFMININSACTVRVGPHCTLLCCTLACMYANFNYS